MYFLLSVPCLQCFDAVGWAAGRASGARFTKYLTTILRLSYDNAKVTIDLRRTSNLQKHPTKGVRLF